MTVAQYADYIADLRTLFGELDRRPEVFQTMDVRLELTVAGGLVVYEARRRKGQTDRLYYGRSATSGRHQQISQAAAFTAIDRFFALGQFAALSAKIATDSAGQPQSVNAQYPHCAVNFSYRKRGQPESRSMLMVFVGFNNDADASQFAATVDDPSVFVTQRPHAAVTTHEWR